MHHDDSDKSGTNLAINATPTSLYTAAYEINMSSTLLRALDLIVASTDDIPENRPSASPRAISQQQLHTGDAEFVPSSALETILEWYCGPVCPKDKLNELAAQAAIREGPMPRTTLIMYNVPTHLTAAEIGVAIAQRGFTNAFNFVYTPIDTQRRLNMGYAFVNFNDHELARAAISSLVHLDILQTRHLRLEFARVQGFRANVEHFASSPAASTDKIMANDHDLRPLLVDEQGLRVPFPLPSNAAYESEQPKSSKVFLGGLPPPCLESDILQALSEMDPQLARGVSMVTIVRDRVTGLSKGFAFVTFAAPKFAAALLRSPTPLTLSHIFGQPVLHVKNYLRGTNRSVKRATMSL